MKRRPIFRGISNRQVPFRCGGMGGRGKIGLEGFVDLLSGSVWFWVFGFGEVSSR
jgi:hypothetical protein